MRDYDQTIRELRDPQYVYHYSRDYLKSMMDDAADAIEELSMKLHGDEAAIAGMKREIERMVVSGNKPRWIPVPEPPAKEDE